MADELFELEGLSPEEIEAAIKDSPELQKMYKSMQTGWTRKTQSLASERAKYKDLETQIEALTSHIGEWETWHKDVEPYLKRAYAGDYDRDQDLSGDKSQSRSRRSKGDPDPMEALLERLDGVEGMLTVAARDFKGRLDSYDRMMDLNLQLSDLYRRAGREGRELDAKKVLQMALDKGYKTLDDAYDAVYRDDIIKGDVEKLTKERVDQELAKKKTEVETGSGYQPTHLTRAKDVPKSFSDATKQALEEKQAETK